MLFFYGDSFEHFPAVFFRLFAQDERFIAESISVVRIISIALLIMSVANIWLNGVTGTGKTRMNLLIEIIAISLYLMYTIYFMKLHYVSLAIAWTNEFIYWTSIFIMAFSYLKSGRLRNKANASKRLMIVLWKQFNLKIKAKKLPAMITGNL